MTAQGATAPPVERSLDERVARAVRGFFGRDSLYMVVWALQVIGAALLTPVITRVMGAAEFGGVAAANAVMQVVFVVAGAGLSMAIQRRYAGADGATAARRLLTFALLAALAITLVVDGTGPLWSPHLGFGGYHGAVRLAVLWAGVSAVTNSALALLRSHDRLLVFSSVSLLQSVVAEAASLALVAAVRPTASMFLLGQLLAQVLALALALASVRPASLRRSDGELVAAALRFGVPLVPAVLGTFVLAAADRFIVQAQLGATAVARYQVAYNIGAMPVLLIGLLNTAWLPRIFAVSDHAERGAVLAAGRDTLYRLLIPVVVGLSVGSPIVLRIWAPPEYRPDDLLVVTAVVIVAVLPYTAGLTASRALLAEGRTARIAVATLVAAVANIVLNLALVPPYGLVGSALATLLAYAGLQQLLARTGGQTVARTPPVLVAGLVLAALAALLAPALPTSPGFLVLRALVVLACAGWFAWRLASVIRA
jgi:O-antigen/teichoic acid export membrane protein